MERHGVVPYLHCPDAGVLADFLVAHLGFTERSRWSEPDGEVRNVELEVGPTEVWLDGDAAWWADHGEHARQWIGLWVADVEEVDAARSRLADAGLEPSEPVTRDFGVRTFDVTDPAGHTWGVMARTDP